MLLCALSRRPRPRPASRLPARSCGRYNGVVAATYPAADLDTATRIDCRWSDTLLLNTTGTPQSGAAHLFVRSSSSTDADPVLASPFSGICDRTMNAHAIVPIALAGQAGGPACNASATPWCKWGDTRQLTLGTRAWTTGVNYTQIRVAPLMKLPVGGLWRLSMWAARLSEPPGDPKQPGTPVNRHIITFDANFHQASAAPAHLGRSC